MADRGKIQVGPGCRCRTPRCEHVIGYAGRIDGRESTLGNRGSADYIARGRINNRIQCPTDVGDGQVIVIQLVQDRAGEVGKYIVTPVVVDLASGATEYSIGGVTNVVIARPTFNIAATDVGIDNVCRQHTTDLAKLGGCQEGVAAVQARVHEERSRWRDLGVGTVIHELEFRITFKGFVDLVMAKHAGRPTLIRALIVVRRGIVVEQAVPRDKCGTVDCPVVTCKTIHSCGICAEVRETSAGKRTRTSAVEGATTTQRTGAEITFRLGNGINSPITEVGGDVTLAVGTVDAHGHVDIVSTAIPGAPRGLDQNRPR